MAAYYYNVLLFAFILNYFSLNAELSSIPTLFTWQEETTALTPFEGNFSSVIRLQDSANDDIDILLGCVTKDKRCVVKKIAYETTKDTQVLPIHYSACYRCGVCMAVAKELNALFSNIQDVIEYLPWKKNSDREIDPGFLTMLANATCHKSFKRHGIRTNAQRERSISAAVYKDQTTRLKTTFDEQWPEKLRETCLLFLHYYGDQKLYQDWLRAQDKSAYIVQRLCQSEGLFRDCSGIPLERTLGEKRGKNLEFSSKTCVD